MTTFDDRERQEEARFSHDQELAFKIRNRRNKLFGLYAAELLGHKGKDADDYARAVVLADFEHPRGAEVFDKVKADLESAGIEVEERTLRRRFETLEATASEQVRSE